MNSEVQVNKTAVVLVNVGTPNSPSVSDVRRYLNEFLSDGRVIDLPWLPRQLLVKGIIVPFRAPKSAKLYKALWTTKGSPLLMHSFDFAQKLSEIMTNVDFFVAMRYGRPSLKEVVDLLVKNNYQQWVFVPMYPHYASSTSGTTIERVMQLVKSKNVLPHITFTGQFFNHPLFIKALLSRIKAYDVTSFDHVLFSYHGLPQRHVNRTHAGKTCEELGCKTIYNNQNMFCYHAACYETSRLIANALELGTDRYTTAFQSRLGKGWLEPFSDEVVAKLAQNGTAKLLVVSPAFVADCLETTIEIGVEYKEIFVENGGQTLQLVEGLNASSVWVEAFAEILKSYLPE